jgi:hypothetical protein
VTSMIDLISVIGMVMVAFNGIKLVISIGKDI